MPLQFVVAFVVLLLQPNLTAIHADADSGLKFNRFAPALVSNADPRQVVLQPKDVPSAAEVKSQTHVIAGLGICLQGYQSLFSSGWNGLEAPYSSAYKCPSAAAASQQFVQVATYYRQYHDRSEWHFRILANVAAGHQHFAWFNKSLPGVQVLGTNAKSLATISLLFTRDNFLVFLQLTYRGETLAHAEQSAHHLAHLMNRRVVLGAT